MVGSPRVGRSPAVLESPTVLEVWIELQSSQSRIAHTFRRNASSAAEPLLCACALHYIWESVGRARSGPASCPGTSASSRARSTACAASRTARRSSPSARGGPALERSRQIDGRNGPVPVQTAIRGRGLPSNVHIEDPVYRGKSTVVDRDVPPHASGAHCGAPARGSPAAGSAVRRSWAASC
jgi:hypothetical protein